MISQAFAKLFVIMCILSHNLHVGR